ncbi:hypothetical protein GWK47_024434 [Chionoecetes opilio]|uniref:Uncharacterized protein n=1 Tax=Chionoecetes opilio TaxID=41210 RepID=A0A8J4XLL4_CHIOP|nr:hypothetical protein GWK47_024434 [Chionoecetes opilio]
MSVPTFVIQVSAATYMMGTSSHWVMPMISYCLHLSHCYSLYCNSLCVAFKVATLNRSMVCQNDILQRLLVLPRWTILFLAFAWNGVKHVDPAVSALGPAGGTTLQPPWQQAGAAPTTPPTVPLSTSFPAGYANPSGGEHAATVPLFYCNGVTAREPTEGQPRKCLSNTCDISLGMKPDWSPRHNSPPATTPPRHADPPLSVEFLMMSYMPFQPSNTPDKYLS